MRLPRCGRLTASGTLRAPWTPSASSCATNRARAASGTFPRDSTAPYSTPTSLTACVSQAANPLFEPPNVAELFQSVRGLLRLINRNAHCALTAAALNNACIVNPEELRLRISLTSSCPPSSPTRPPLKSPNSSTTSPSPPTANTSLISAATTTTSANAQAPNARATTGNSTSSTVTTCRSESPTVPTIANNARLIAHDWRLVETNLIRSRAIAAITAMPAVSVVLSSISPASVLRQGAGDVRNRASVDQK